MISYPTTPYCPVCASTHTEVLWKDVEKLNNKKQFEYQFLRCSRCNHHFVNPFPDFETICHLYENNYYSRRCDNRDLYKSLYPRIKVLIAKHRFALHSELKEKNSPKIDILRLLAIIAELLVGRLVSFSLSRPLSEPLSSIILDVGCGNGSWLAFMNSKGYQNLEGNEIDCCSGEYLNQMGIIFHCGDLMNLNLREQHYDLIRLEHVLEHVSDPLTYLERIASLLKEKGVIVMTIPTIDSPCFRIANRDWHPLELPRHLNMFSLQSLLSIIDKAGLVVYRYRYLPEWKGCRTSIIQSMTPPSSKIARAIIALLSNRLLSIMMAPGYSWVLRAMGKGDFISVECHKREITE